MYRQVENANYFEEPLEEFETSKTLVDLVQFVNYEFIVKAENSVGQGPPSTPVIVFVGEAGETSLHDFTCFGWHLKVIEESYDTLKCC